eukprot:sb/3476129/
MVYLKCVLFEYILRLFVNVYPLSKLSISVEKTGANVFLFPHKIYSSPIPKFTFKLNEIVHLSDCIRDRKVVSMLSLFVYNTQPTQILDTTTTVVPDHMSSCRRVSGLWFSHAENRVRPML